MATNTNIEKNAFLILMGSPGKVTVKKPVRAHHREVTNKAEINNILEMLLKAGSLRAYQKRQRGIAKGKQNGTVPARWHTPPMTPRTRGSPEETVDLEPEDSAPIHNPFELIQELDSDDEEEEEMPLRRHV